MDYNFFESSGKKSKKSSNKVVSGIIIGAIVVVFAVLAGLTIKNVFATNGLKDDIAAKEEEIIAVEAKLKSISEKEERKTSLAYTAKFLTALNMAAINSRTVNTEVLDKITGEVPKDGNGVVQVKLTSMKISNKSVSLEATTNKYSRIYEFQKNLMDLKLEDTKAYAFTNIVIPSIDTETEGIDGEDALYKFTMELNVNFNVDLTASSDSINTAVDGEGVMTQ